MLAKLERGIIHPIGISAKSGHPLMIRSIHIQGYRGFSEFEMNNLARVNLLVGTNNSGKTSALEALYLLASQGDPNSLWRVLWRRSERLPERSARTSTELDICHLFTGHDLRMGSKFVLSAENDVPGRNVTFTVGDIPDEQRTKTAVREGVAIASRFGLHIKGYPAPNASVIPLSRSGGLSAESLDVPRRLQRRSVSDEEIPSQFITAESYGGSELVGLWEAVSLTSNEERVLNALRLLEPTIDKIASISITPEYGGGNLRGGFRVKFKNVERPVPIGSLGDGIWRLLVIAIAIAQCKDGILLIDEIDTGLHYSVMADMWRLIYGAANELNVQVFATTHSNDCIRALAEVCCSEENAGKDVTLQRIERGRKKSVPYSAAEIEVAATRGIEVR